MPSDYGPFPYTPITERPRLNWPGGAHLAVWVIPKPLSFSAYARIVRPPIRSQGQTSNGPAMGTARLRQPCWDMADYGCTRANLRIRATASINADICIQHPQIVRAAVDRNWEFIGHNITNTERLTELDEAAERQTIAKCAKTIADASGRRPIGWLGAALAETWHTLDYLIDEGFQYVADWTNDDQPYLMTVGKRQIVSISYSYEVNNSPFIYYRNGTIDEFEKLIRRQFDVLYEEGAVSGRVMAICVHPFIIGVPHRIRGFKSALKYIASHDKVWFATGSEIIQHYRASGATF